MACPLSFTHSFGTMSAFEFQGNPVSYPARLAGRGLGKLGLTIGVLVAAVGLSPQQSLGKGPAPTEAAVASAQLPPEAQHVERLIRAGGPFEHAKDGAVFGNYERRLPGRPRGYYREYTVPTPGARGRGARRIVCGGRIRRNPETCYYTEDHFSSFRRIEQ